MPCDLFVDNWTFEKTDTFSSLCRLCLCWAVSPSQISWVCPEPKDQSQVKILFRSFLIMHVVLACILLSHSAVYIVAFKCLNFPESHPTFLRTSGGLLHISICNLLLQLVWVCSLTVAFMSSSSCFSYLRSEIKQGQILPCYSREVRML